MIYSANYSLKEPQKNVDLADVNDLNYNTEAIDGLIHNTQISLAPAYDHTLTYEVGDLVMYDTLLYKCITAITVAEAWDATKWERAVLSDSAGGGGNANVTEITYAQYQALTPAEKANGTIYAVTNDPSDSASGGGGGGGLNYSTIEQNTGLKWVDGKDIYQKTYHFTELTEQRSKNYDISADNIDFVIASEGTVKFGSNGGFGWCSMPYFDSSSYHTDICAQNTSIAIVSEGWYFTEAYVTLRYTKSTPSQA